MGELVQLRGRRRRSSGGSGSPTQRHTAKVLLFTGVYYTRNRSAAGRSAPGEPKRQNR